MARILRRDREVLGSAWLAPGPAVVGRSRPDRVASSRALRPDSALTRLPAWLRTDVPDAEACLPVRPRTLAKQARSGPSRLGRILLPLLLLCPIPALALGVLEIAGAPVGLHPFGARSLPVGAAAAYFNPALLPLAPGGFEVGVFTFVQGVHVDLHERPAGVDVDAAIYDARAVVDGGTQRLELRPLPSADLRRPRGSADPFATDVFLALGHATRFLDDRLAIGLFGVIPLSAFQSHEPFFADEREQYFSNSLHFELLGDRARIAAFSFAAAGRPLEWLSLGAGLVIVTAVAAHTEVYIPDSADQETAHVRSATTTRFRVAPHFALAATPIRPLRLTATVHLPVRATVAGETEIQFWSYPYPEGQDALVQPFRFTFGDLPLRVAAGASWSDRAHDVLDWAVALESTWTRWSTYRDRVDERAGFDDTFSLAAGAEVGYAGHRVGVDLAWLPSPVPPQRGRSSHVDNDRVGVSAAWDWTIPLGSIELVAGLQLQVQALVERRVRKSADARDPVLDEFPDAVDLASERPIAASHGLQTNNPGYPGFTSGGWLLGASAWLRLRL